MKSIKNLDPRQWSELPVPINSQPCGYTVCFYGQSSWCTSSWAVIMTGMLPCGDLSICGLLQSNNIGFASQPVPDEIISCPPPPPHQSWAIYSYRFAIPLSSLQVPRCLGDTPGSRSCKPSLGHPVTNAPIWYHESSSSHTELNSQAAKLPAALWARPVWNKVKLA